jgi:hypothetical protein
MTTAPEPNLPDEVGPVNNWFANELRSISGTHKAESICRSGATEIERLERALAIARSVATADEQMVRNDERQRLAALIDENADTIGKFASDPVAAVRLVGLMIGLQQ